MEQLNGQDLAILGFLFLHEAEIMHYIRKHLMWEKLLYNCLLFDPCALVILQKDLGVISKISLYELMWDL